MNSTLFFIVAAVLLLVRLAAQWRARGQEPTRPLRGRVSVVCWLVIYLVLLAGALYEVHVSEAISIPGVVLILVMLGLRAAGLHALRGHYHEAIAVQEAHGVVRTGVYRVLRHPLHLALLGEMIGLALLCGRLWTIPCVVAALLVLLHRNREEERVLLEHLGASYGDYLEGRAWDLIDLLPARSARVAGP